MAKTDFEYFIVGMSVEEGSGEGYFRKINFEHDAHINFILYVYYFTSIDYLLSSTLKERKLLSLFPLLVWNQLDSKN